MNEKYVHGIEMAVSAQVHVAVTHQNCIREVLDQNLPE
jgi:hypothetical protein